jgi:hypothetical protein
MSGKPAILGLVGPVWSQALKSMQPAVTPDDARVLVRAADDVENPEFLAFYGDVAVPFATRVPRERRIIVISEPPAIVRYRPGFLAQFGTAVTPFDLPGFSGNLVRSQPAIPWFYGCTFGKGREPAWRYTFEELEALTPPPKINAISAVLSKKNQAPLHVARVTCAEELVRRFPENIRLFGSGFDPIDDKAEAIDPYRFHLALENTRDPYYWSEKIADAYLGWAMPVYEGCTGIANSFPEASFARIDVHDIPAAVRTVGALLEAGEKAVPMPALIEARARLLHEHALPAVLRRAAEPLLGEVSTRTASQSGILRPNSAFSLRGRMRSLVRRFRAGKEGA